MYKCINVYLLYLILTLLKDCVIGYSTKDTLYINNSINNYTLYYTLYYITQSNLYNFENCIFLYFEPGLNEESIITTFYIIISIINNNNAYFKIIYIYIYIYGILFN